MRPSLNPIVVPVVAWTVVSMVGAGIAPAAPTVDDRDRVEVSVPDHGLDETAAIVHALNRVGYGPRTGDVQAVRTLGVEAWIQRQLEPEGIPDAHVTRLLEPYRTLDLDRIEILTRYTAPNVLRRLARRLERTLGEGTVDEYFPELEGKGKKRSAGSGRGGVGRLNREMAQAKLIRALYSERQLLEVMTDFWFNHFNVYRNKGADRWLIATYEREAIRPHALGNFRDLLGATARHPAMLFYLDNWVSSSARADFGRVDIGRYAVEAIREQRLPPGGVATLILRDRGMDTDEVERALQRQDTRIVRASEARRSNRMRRSRRPSADLPGRAGLNENYARELLELHTLGVEGGYNQQDIVAVARCFTGWTLLPVHAGQGFVYVDELHDRKKKVVLGKKIKAKGVEEGEQVLDRLAAHPSTARFIARKLAVRFVSDDPPAALIDRVAASFHRSDGDIRTVLATLFSSPEFWSPEAVGAKVKTPFEFVVSAGRATGLELALLPGTSVASAGMTMGRTSFGEQPEFEIPEGMDAESFGSIVQPPGLLKLLTDLGQPPYSAEPPTGYKDTADAWISTGALLSRMKLALSLAVNRIPGARTYLDVQPEDAETAAEYLDRLGASLLGQPLPEGTRAAILDQLGLSPDVPATEGTVRRARGRSGDAQSRIAAGWILSSAEFQRR